MAAIRAVRGVHSSTLTHSKATTKKATARHKEHSPINAIRKSLHENQIARTKELFHKALDQNIDIEPIAKTLYNELKVDVGDKKVFDKFKKLYCELAISQSIIQNNAQILHTPIAKQCGIQKKSNNFFIEALQGIGTSRAKRVASEIDSVSKIPFPRHKLDPLSMLTVCLIADRELHKLAHKTKAVYMRGQDLQIPRSLVLDPLHRRFTILSKKFGELNAEGAFKRVTDAVEVTPDVAQAAARRVAHVRNKADERIPTEELDYEKLYGDIITWTRYKSKNRPKETKTLILQEVYDHDLYLFTEHTPESLRKKISLVEMLQVLEQVGKSLLKMHEDRLVHRDVKAKNVLFRRTTKGNAEAKLIDFGHCYDPQRADTLKKRKKGYGTLRYTATDLLEDPYLKGDQQFLAKAEDCYALGQIIYEVYLQKVTPWGSLTYRALKKKEDAEENRATAIRLQKQEAAFYANESLLPPYTHEKELLWIMSRLLDPNPFTRMQMAEFMTALYDLKGRYDTLSPVSVNKETASP